MNMSGCGIPIFPLNIPQGLLYSDHMGSEIRKAIESNDVDGIPVIGIIGYFDDELGERMNTLALDIFRRGKTRFIIDFTGCITVNSLGVSHLFDLCLRAVEEFGGRIVLVRISSTMEELFDFTGILEKVDLAPSVQVGISLIRCVDS